MSYIVVVLGMLDDCERQPQEHAFGPVDLPESINLSVGQYFFSNQQSAFLLLLTYGNPQDFDLII